jgi:hypothetical protein
MCAKLRYNKYRARHTSTGNILPSRRPRDFTKKEKYECEYDDYGHITSLKIYEWVNVGEDYVFKTSVASEYHQLKPKKTLNVLRSGLPICLTEIRAILLYPIL